MKKALSGSVVGLDLSLRSAAACAIPLDWTPGDWSTVRTVVAGHALKTDALLVEAVERLILIAEAMSGFAVQNGAKAVYLEDYAYGLAGRGGMRIGELGGAVKTAVYRATGLVVIPVNMMTARKYLLGKLPRANQAAATINTLKSAGAAWSTSDEYDAFCVANFALSEMGVPGLSIASSG